ncbi:Asp23/Gls24 family envelope stress response protein [Enterococcus faecium]|uniref:Asp23/Gls24 family envelope stress response protein n=1 Tax=Enterococcus faecium TaxID=1352 RepID=UPI0020735248|nr:Asp23/Gls24 family envelope stress response protein [Enterococcus faecium]MCM6854490.1 Asp23/Gls24 family envelope stress response protein [Enterococcus faecium]MCM6865164.1 Asp23/Gls24 family envelope stress response protein [Enterococcus faecium]MCM6882715.1 Asp23/Gls24 family envelope stress response protein [Enterococcus faecium]MCM6898486.1 Asp23/Gls24 family envelope stress response protein [Enterococcus faecium]MCM6904353.1 Asp23/Gls24 family envelope stress response protein [Enteroc
MNNNNKNNNNKMNNQKPVSAHPDPTTPNQSNGVNDEKNKTAPVSAHPDPVVPNVQQGVEEKKHDAEKHAPHHPGTPESKVPEQHDAIDPSKPVEEQKHPSDHAKAQEKLSSDHTNGQGKLGSDHTNNQGKHDSEQEDSMRGELNYEDKVVQKIIGIAIEQVDGLLSANGGFFSNVAGKLVNTDNVTAGIETEVGKKQVAVDMDVIVEYGKDIEKIFEEMQEVIVKEVKNMTHLEVIEVNANVVDIKTKEEFEKDQETVQDKVTDAAKKTGEFASNQTDKVKSAAGSGAQKVKENTEPRVQ